MKPLLRVFRIVLLAVLLIGAASQARAQSQYDINHWYWSVQDQSPGSQVYSTIDNAFVALSNAGYVAWQAQDGGNLPTSIDTKVNLFALFDVNARTVRRVNRQAPGGASAQMTNPTALYQDVNATDGKVSLSRMGTPVSIPVNVPLYISNAADDGLTVYLYDTTTALMSIPSGLTGIAFLVDNSDANGTWISFVLPSTDPSNASNLVAGTLNCLRTAAYTGDVTKSAGSCVTTLANIPNDTAMAGDILATNSAAPSTPSSGQTRVYVDSTSKNLAAKNDAGTVNHGVQTKASVSHNFLTAISDAGAVSAAQPACGDLSNAAASCSTDTTSASNISSGTLAAARGGAGTVNGALKGNGSGAVSQAACADLSNGAASCSTDTTSASNISSGTLAAARGGAGTVNGALKGNGSGAVSQAACADLSNGSASCSTDATNASNISSGTLARARGGSDYVLLSTLTASSSASVSDTSNITASYNTYVITFENVLPATNAVSLEIQVTEDNGSNWKTTSYLNSAGGGTDALYVNGATAIDNTAGAGVSGTCWFYSANSTTAKKMMRCLVGFLSGAATGNVNTTSLYNGDNGAINGLKFFQSGGGNIASGVIRIYGVKTS